MWWYCTSQCDGIVPPAKWLIRKNSGLYHQPLLFYHLATTVPLYLTKWQSLWPVFHFVTTVTALFENRCREREREVEQYSWLISSSRAIRPHSPHTSWQISILWNWKLVKFTPHPDHLETLWNTKEGRRIFPIELALGRTGTAFEINWKNALICILNC